MAGYADDQEMEVKKSMSWMADPSSTGRWGDHVRKQKEKNAPISTTPLTLVDRLIVRRGLPPARPRPANVAMRHNVVAHRADPLSQVEQRFLINGERIQSGYESMARSQGSKG